MSWLTYNGAIKIKPLVLFNGGMEFQSCVNTGRRLHLIKFNLQTNLLPIKT